MEEDGGPCRDGGKVETGRKRVRYPGHLNAWGHLCICLVVWGGEGPGTPGNLDRLPTHERQCVCARRPHELLADEEQRAGAPLLDGQPRGHGGPFEALFRQSPRVGARGLLLLPVTGFPPPRAPPPPCPSSAGANLSFH